MSIGESKEKCYMCGKEGKKGNMRSFGAEMICFECKENEDLIHWEMEKQRETADKYNFEQKPKWRRNDNAWR